MKKKNSRQLGEAAKRIFKEHRKSNKVLGVKLICTKCNEEHFVRTHQPEIYTEEVREKWTCLMCTPFKRERHDDSTKST